MINDDEDRIVHGGELEYGSLAEVVVEAPEPDAPKGVLLPNEFYMSYLIRRLREEGIKVPPLKYSITKSWKSSKDILTRSQFGLKNCKYLTLEREISQYNVSQFFPESSMDLPNGKARWRESVDVVCGTEPCGCSCKTFFKFLIGKENTVLMRKEQYPVCGDWLFCKYFPKQKNPDSPIISVEMQDPVGVLEDLVRYIRENGLRAGAK